MNMVSEFKKKKKKVGRGVFCLWIHLDVLNPHRPVYTQLQLMSDTQCTLVLLATDLPCQNNFRHNGIKNVIQSFLILNTPQK